MLTKNKFKKKFPAYYFLKVFLHHFSQVKVKKKSQNSRNQGFAYYFCLMKEGSGSRRPKTRGSGGSEFGSGSGSTTLLKSKLVFF
jgi:hypothetical protein